MSNNTSKFNKYLRSIPMNKFVVLCLIITFIVSTTYMSNAQTSSAGNRGGTFFGGSNSGSGTGSSNNGTSSAGNNGNFFGGGNNSGNGTGSNNNGNSNAGNGGNFFGGGTNGSSTGGGNSSNSSTGNTGGNFFCGGTNGGGGGGNGGGGGGNGRRNRSSSNALAISAAVSTNNVNNSVSLNQKYRPSFPSFPYDGFESMTVAPPTSNSTSDWNTSFDMLPMFLNEPEKQQFQRDNVDLKKREEQTYGVQRQVYVGRSSLFLQENLDAMLEKYNLNKKYESSNTNLRNFFHQENMLVATTNVMGNNVSSEKLAGWLLYRSSQMGANVVYVGTHNVKQYTRSTSRKTGFKFPIALGLPLGMAGLSVGAPNERMAISYVENAPYMADVLFLRLDDK